MLYPNEEGSELLYVCKSCNYKEPAVNALTYRNALKEEVAETAGNVLDVAQDPTVGNDPSAFAHSYAHAHDHDSAMELGIESEEIIPEICTLCGQEILCPICGEPSGNGIALETEEPSDDDPQLEAERIDMERRERALSGAHHHH